MIKVNGEVIKRNTFLDGTLHIKPKYYVDNRLVISWHYEDDAEFLMLAFLTKYYQARGNKIDLFMPYVPNGRMDRVEERDDVFTLKYFGELINSLNFENVIVLDVHSSVSMAVINKCHCIDTKELFNTTVKQITYMDGETPIIFYPDEGAMKRYSHLHTLPYAFGVKTRDWNTGKIRGFEILGMPKENICGKNVLIQDDICTTGGTFYYAAKALKKMGAKNIYLLVTHCEDSIFDSSIGKNHINLLDSGLIEHIFTTDSIFFDKNYENDNRFTIYKVKVHADTDIADTDVNDTENDVCTNCDSVCINCCLDCFNYLDDFDLDCK